MRSINLCKNMGFTKMKVAVLPNHVKNEKNLKKQIGKFENPEKKTKKT